MKFRFLIGFSQTILWCIAMTARYFTIEPNGKLIIGTTFPFIILIFLIIGLVQSVLVPILEKKIITWVMLTLSTLILTVLFCIPLNLWSLLFFLIAISILFMPTLIKYNQRSEGNKPIA